MKGILFMSLGKALALGLKGATVIGGVAGGVSIGEIILKRFGLMKPGTQVIPEVTHVMLDIAGVDKKATLRPLLNPLLGAVEPPTANVSIVCPMCYAYEKRPILAGVAGEEIRIQRCKGHEVAADAVLDGVEALYLGYAEAAGVDNTNGPQRNDYRDAAGNVAEYPYLQDLAAWRSKVEIGAGGCGPQPTLADDAFRGMFGPNETAYYKALAAWDSCTADAKAAAEAKQKDKETKAEAKQDKADKAAADKAQKEAVAAQKKAEKEKTEKAVADAKAKAKKAAEAYQKVAQAALQFEKRKADQRIAELQAMQAKKESDAEKAAMQTQIDQLKQQSAIASQLAAETSQKATSDAQQAKIDQLQMLIASKGTVPGGMDELFRIAAQSQTQMPAGVPWQAMPPQFDDGSGGYAQQPYFADQYADQTGFDFEGAAKLGDSDFELLDADIAEYLGLPEDAIGLEGNQVFAMKQLGYTAEDLAAFYEPDDDDDDATAGLSGCAIGACGRMPAHG